VGGDDQPAQAHADQPHADQPHADQPHAAQPHAAQREPSQDAVERALALGPGDVAAARARLAGRVLETPVLRFPALDELAGAELWLKLENLQHVGAFKARGALLALTRLDPAARRRGVITYSSGNHAQALALAAREFGTTATIVMPVDAPAVKVGGVRALGAEVVFVGTTSDARRDAAYELAHSSGKPVVEPFDDEDVLLGQATATAELLETLDTRGVTLDALLVPTGGGGLLAGACLAATDRGLAIHPVEPAGCDSMGQSLRAGRRVRVGPAPSIADGLRTVMPGLRTFAIARRDAAAGIVVDDDAMAGALLDLLEHGKVLAEPSGAAGLAAALTRTVPGTPRRIGVIVTGGNVDPRLVTRLLADRHAAG
jgi:threo-3-hydroxy-L-aspartate ammonia-lyase